MTAPMLGVRRTPLTTTASDADPSRDGVPDSGPADPLHTDTPWSPDASAEPDDLARLKLKKKPLGDVLRGLVLAATVAVHQALARTEAEQQMGVWLMDEDEAAGVADPLANIANRRAGGALVNPDAGDLIAAGVAAAGYVINNAIQAFKIRRAVRRAGYHTEPEESDV